VVIASDLADRLPSWAEIEEKHKVVRDLKVMLEQTSICGLGYVAHAPLSSVLDYFPEDVNRRVTTAPPPNPEPATPASGS
jgi:NADH:ubiquinone oxidoreductase subunit F (NADH-binding)